MRVLVTGHNGYIGSVLTPVFVAAGHEVVGLDSYLYTECSLGDSDVDVPSHRIDLRDIEGRHVEGFDAVVHLAALSNDAVGDLAASHTYDINHTASVRLARLARDAGVRRFLYSSSCSVYGVQGDEAVGEDAPMAPVTAYAISKTLVEDDLRELADRDFSPVYLRNATVYGLSARLRVDVVLNNLVGWAHLTGEVKLVSDGTPWRPVVHVRDVASAFLAALEAPSESVHNEAINVGDAAENYRIRELAEIVGDTVPGSRVVITGEAGSDVRSYRVDFSKLARLLPEFHPEWNARRGAKELYDAYRRFGLTRAQFDERFVRLRWLASLQREQRLGDDLRWCAAIPAAATPNPTMS